MFTGLKKQLDFGDDLISRIVPQTHDLVSLKHILNWKKMNKIYQSCYKSKKGNATKHTELVLGLIILKFLYQRPYRLLISELHVNMAFMYFCSVSLDDILKCQEATEEDEENKQLIDHSTLVKIVKRMGSKKIKKIEKLFTDDLKAKKIIKGKHLFSDTTSMENNILYPTDISLLKRVIERAEMIIQKVIYKKDMVKSEIIKKANQICKVYYSASKKTKELLSSCGKGLLVLAQKSIGLAKNSVKNCTDIIVKVHLEKAYSKLKDIGIKIIDQAQLKLASEKVNNKIVSYFEDHARPLPKGKVSKPCEFGMKFRVDMDENHYITNYKLYLGNVADVNMLEEAIKEHSNSFGENFKSAALDRGFYDKDLIEELEEKYNIQIAIPHKKDRTKKMSKYKEALYKKRAAIEAKISEGKRMCGLAKSLFTGFEGDKIWASLSVFALNIRKLLRDIKNVSGIFNKFF